MGSEGRAPQRPIRPGIFAVSEDGPPSILASRCDACGALAFPPEGICPSCFRPDSMKSLRVRGRGTLYVHTIVRVAPPGFTAPYAVGYVDLEDGLRLFAPVDVERFEDLEIGMPMEVVVAPIRRDGDVDVIGYRFRPVAA